MNFQIESIAKCVPITALLVIDKNESISLLVGSGSFLHVYDGISSQELLSRRVFKTQKIHGLTFKANNREAGQVNEYDLIIWGGRSVCFGRLILPLTSQSLPIHGPILTISQIAQAPDWILEAVFPETSTSPGNEGFLLTARNSVFHLTEAKAGATSVTKTSINVLIHGPRSFLYAGDISIAKPDVLLVASGTVFGELLFWTCNRDSTTSTWSANLQRSFTGHKGSIFGVTISERPNELGKPAQLLATCSDDRTIRLWNINDCEGTGVKSNTIPVQVSTGFCTSDTTDISPFAMAWAHISRIWGIKFLEGEPLSHGSDRFLLSHGEDATCQLWCFNHGRIPDSEDLSESLRLVSSDRYHTGKNIWSMTHCIVDDQLLVFTGGADGRIVSRYRRLIPNQANFDIVQANLSDVPLSLGVLKQYHILDRNAVLAITGRGELLIGTTLDHSHFSWKQIFMNKQRSGLKLCRNFYSHVAYVVDEEGNIYVMIPGSREVLTFPLTSKYPVLEVRVAHETYFPKPILLEVFLVLATANRSEVDLVWVVLEPGNANIRQVSLNLPATFVVTCARYDKSTNTAILGSRAGAIAVYSNVRFDAGPTSEAHCYRHIHGSDSVNSILVLPEPEPGNVQDAGAARRLHLLTTGRDGSLKVHRLGLSAESEIADTLTTVHASSTTFGTHIEGAYLIRDPGHAHSFDLFIFGFRSRDFIVWNEALDIIVFEVDCGGAHRSWDFKQENNDTAMFAWTKAGVFNFIAKMAEDHKNIQTGGHGREIKALAQHSKPSLFSGIQSSHVRLVATGAEDTTIRLFAIADSSTKSAGGGYSFRCVATLREHMTGIQHLAFSGCGIFLFSSAGCEEFLVWRLSSNLPCFAIGVTLYDVMPTQERERDARITSFVVEDRMQQHASASDRPSFTIILAYSNGKIKVISYVSGNALRQGHFETLYEIPHGSFCLTQAGVLQPPQSGIWKILSAGTNGFLNLHQCTTPTQLVSGRIQQANVHSIHQSTIMTMTTLKLADDIWLIITGGDDNAMGLTILQTSSSATNFRTFLIPSAHAAGLTALDAVSVSCSSLCTQVYIATGGNDQKIKFWTVKFPTKLMSSSISDISLRYPKLENIELEKIAEGWTAIADVSNVKILEHHYDEGKEDARILITGVGMEVIRLKPEEKP